MPDNVHNLSWYPNTSCADFITSVSNAMQRHAGDGAVAVVASQKPPQLLSLEVDDTFWTKFCALSEVEAIHVLSVLKNAPLTDIYFICLQLSIHGPNLTATEACVAFHRLCDALGSIRTITSAHINVADDVLSGRLGYAIRALTSLTHTSINVRGVDAVVNRSIASALAHHPALCSFTLECEASVLQTYVTVLSTLPNLKKFALEVCFFGDSQVLSFNEAEALVEVMRMDRPLSIELEMRGYKLTDPASHRLFCAGLAETKAQGFELDCCEMIDAVSFARAVTSSCLSAFHFSELKFVEHGGSTAFLSTLTAGLPLMRNLEDLDVDLIESFGDERVDCEGFVRATASCLRLRRLVLSLRSYTATMDAAMAYCLQTTTSIKDLTIKSPKTAAHEAALDCSLLVEAVKNNYTIRHLRLASSLGSDIVDSWDLDMMANISMICRLNRSGRAYMEADSSNQREGFKVLGDVNEDLNCLYFHLRENPMLCREQSTAKACRKRRRDGDLGSA